MKKADNLPIISFATQQDWEAWLKKHHTHTTGIWLKLAKKETSIPSVSYAEALESASVTTTFTQCDLIWTDTCLSRGSRQSLTCAPRTHGDTAASSRAHKNYSILYSEGGGTYES